MDEKNEPLELIARTLIRCFIGGALLVTFWFVIYVAASDWMYHLQTRWFPITREQFDVIMYCLIAATKVFIYLVFLIPYICLRLVLRKRS